MCAICITCAVGTGAILTKYLTIFVGEWQVILCIFLYSYLCVVLMDKSVWSLRGCVYVDVRML